MSSRPPRLAGRAALVLVTAVAATACSDEANGEDGRVGPIVVAAPDPEGGDNDAIVAGRLVLPDGDECIGLEPTDVAGGATGLVWTSGTAWSGDEGEVSLDGATFAVGDEVRGGGGFHDADRGPTTEITADVLDAVRDCGWDEFAFLERLD